MVSRHLLAPIGRDVPSIAAHHQIRQQTGPAGLMGGAQTLAGVAVGSIRRIAANLASADRAGTGCGRERGRSSVRVAAIDVHQSLGDQRTDFLQIQLAITQAGTAMVKLSPRKR